MADLNIINRVIEAQGRIKSMEQLSCKGLMMPNNCANSAPRKIMYATQTEHIIPLFKPEPPILQTGYETIFGMYSSSFIKAETNYKIIAKIPKFSFVPNHHYFVIMQDMATLEYTVTERVCYEYITETYGYLKNNDYLDKLHINEVIPKGSVMQKSTAFDEYNNRQDGVNLLSMYMSDEDTKEDGIDISDEASEMLASPLIKKIPIVINENDIPLNLMGGNNFYKSFPNIGEYVKGGIVLATRREKKDEILFAQSYKRLQEIMMSDEKYTAEGQVIDINIYCNNAENLLENHYNAQLKYYNDEAIRFNKEIVSVLGPLLEDGAKFSYDLQKLYYNCLKILNGKKYMKERPFSNVMLEIVLMERSPAKKGDKISNRYGGKGVISRVLPKEQMPRLDNGEYVHLKFNSSGTVNRENPGQLIETSVNFASARLLEFMSLRTFDYNEMVEVFLKFIKIVIPKQAAYIENYLNSISFDDQLVFMESVLSDENIHLSMEPLSETMTIDTLAALYREFPFIKQYRIEVPQKDSNGNYRYIEARRSVVCGKQYIYRLKQYAEDKMTATSLSATNIKNENTRTSAKKSYKLIHGRTPVKFGDMESGDLLHMGAELVISNLMLYSASPLARRLTEQLLTDDPFNIDIKLDSESKNRGVEILNAYMLTMGLKLNFVKVYKQKKMPILINPITTVRKRLVEPISIEDHGDSFTLSYLFKEEDKTGIHPILINPIEIV